MSSLFWLADEQMERLQPCFSKSHGKPRFNDWRVLDGIIFINRIGLRWSSLLWAAKGAVQSLKTMERYG